jgi:uncharacterized protein (DUF1330 family)
LDGGLVSTSPRVKRFSGSENFRSTPQKDFCNNIPAAAVIASFVLGVAAVNVLHAQVKLPAYVVAEIGVKDQDGYAKDFLPKAQANIRESGGKYLAGGFNKAISLFGSPPPNRVALLQFADMDAVKAFYVKQKQIEADVGNKYASFRVIGIEGVEQK